MDPVFINTESRKTSKPHVLTLKLSDKIDLRTVENNIAWSTLSIYYTWEKIKKSYKNTKFKV